VERILYLNGYAAQKDRHVGYSEYFGTNMQILVDHLLDYIPNLKETHPKLSTSTIAHLFIPPNISSEARNSYKCLIHARPYHGRNGDHPN